MALGGTLAEEMIFREISNGATSDLEKANRIARSMVKEFGMSRLGRVNFQERPVPAFLAGAGFGGRRSTASERRTGSIWRSAHSR